MKRNIFLLMLSFVLFSALGASSAVGNRYFTPSGENVRFRVTPGTEGTFIRFLVAGEKLKFLEKGNEETIKGTRGAWCKFETEKGETGWCFDAFLNEIVATITTPPVHSKPVYSVAFSPDGKWVLSASGDKTIKLWEIQGGKEVRTFSGHTDAVNSVIFSSNGAQALSGSDDRTMKLWDISSGKNIMTFSCYDRVNVVAMSPVETSVLAGIDRVMIQKFGTVSGKELTSLSGHNSMVLSLVYSPDGKYVLSGSWDKTLKLWNADSNTEIRTFNGHSSYVRSVAISPNGKQALSGSEDGNMILWDMGSGKKIRSFIEGAFKPRIFSVAFSPNGKYALCGLADSTIMLWDVTTGKEVRTFNGHSGTVRSVVFSPDGKYVLSGSDDKSIKLWDASTGRCIRSF